MNLNNTMKEIQLNNTQYLNKEQFIILNDTLFWKTFYGDERYKVYSNGTIYSVKSKRFLKQAIINSGYSFIGMRIKNAKRFNKLIHRVVAEHFLENLNEMKTVDHKDGNKQNNDVRNLRWTSRSLNQQLKNKDKSNTSGERNISFIKNRTYSYWRVQIIQSGKTKTKSFRIKNDMSDKESKLQEAIQYRDDILTEYIGKEKEYIPDYCI
jgi:hypothetical protein